MRFIEDKEATKINFDKELNITITVKEAICIYLTLTKITISDIATLIESRFPNISNEDIGNTCEEDISYHTWADLKYNILAPLDIEPEL